MFLCSCYNITFKFKLRLSLLSLKLSRLNGHNIIVMFLHNPASRLRYKQFFAVDQLKVFFSRALWVKAEITSSMLASSSEPALELLLVKKHPVKCVINVFWEYQCSFAWAQRLGACQCFSAWKNGKSNTIWSVSSSVTSQMPHHIKHWLVIR